MSLKLSLGILGFVSTWSIVITSAQPTTPERIESVDSLRRNLTAELYRQIDYIEGNLRWEGPRDMSFDNDYRLKGASQDISAFGETIRLEPGISPGGAKKLLRDVYNMKDLDLQEKKAVLNAGGDPKKIERIKLDFEISRLELELQKQTNFAMIVFNWKGPRDMSFDGAYRLEGPSQDVSVFGETIRLEPGISPGGAKRLLRDVYYLKDLDLQEKKALLNAGGDPMETERIKLDFEISRLERELQKQTNFAMIVFNWKGPRDMSFDNDYRLEGPSQDMSAFGETIRLEPGMRPITAKRLILEAYKKKMEPVTAKLKEIQLKIDAAQAATVLMEEATVSQLRSTTNCKK